MTKYFVGTSGWVFKNWQGIFYPDNLPQSEWLKFYSLFFNCVEVNSTFYRVFATSTYNRWAKSVPDYFRFNLKAPKEITHTKKLVAAKSDILAFLENIQPLENKLGLILLQFPPNFAIDYNIFVESIQIFQEKVKVAIELRNPLGWAQDTIDILVENNCTLVNADFTNAELTHLLTNKTIYYRLHGKPDLHKSSYSNSKLKEIADVLTVLGNRIDEGYIIFNNGLVGNSIYNGIEIQKMLGNEKPFIEFSRIHSPKLDL